MYRPNIIRTVSWVVMLFVCLCYFVCMFVVCFDFVNYREATYFMENSRTPLLLFMVQIYCTVERTENATI